MFKLLFHVCAAVQFSYAVYYDYNHVQVPPKLVSNGSSVGGKFIFLTFWNAIIQVLLYWICIFNDIFGSSDINPKTSPGIKKTLDFLFCTFGFPLTVFVACTFWTLYAIDRELVLPKMLDVYFPCWLNHIMHTNILIFCLVEFVTTPRIYPSRKSALTALIIFLFIYLFWVLIIYAKSGQWVYPIMTALNWPQRVIFLASMLLVVLGLYFVGELLNKVVWGKEILAVNGISAEKIGKKVR